MLESVMSVAVQSRYARFHPGPRDENLRRARVCYNHLAGPYSVALYDAFVRRGFLVLSQPDNDKNGNLVLTTEGRDLSRQRLWPTRALRQVKGVFAHNGY